MLNTCKANIYLKPWSKNRGGGHLPYIFTNIDFLTSDFIFQISLSEWRGGLQVSPHTEATSVRAPHAVKSFTVTVACTIVLSNVSDLRTMVRLKEKHSKIEILECSGDNLQWQNFFQNVLLERHLNAKPFRRLCEVVLDAGFLTKTEENVFLLSTIQQFGTFPKKCVYTDFFLVKNPNPAILRMT